VKTVGKGERLGQPMPPRMPRDRARNSFIQRSPRMSRNEWVLPPNLPTVRMLKRLPCPQINQRLGRIGNCMRIR